MWRSAWSCPSRALPAARTALPACRRSSIVASARVQAPVRPALAAALSRAWACRDRNRRPVSSPMFTSSTPDSVR
ncbi:hypothetical protein ACFFX0_07740 [Citricoccus parietis]|uniref:Secreted protein n=1 Tax=Citricoccus parietis TaxID=592307 RepID=A0ABV5FXD3_9MICC